MLGSVRNMAAGEAAPSCEVRPEPEECCEGKEGNSQKIKEEQLRVGLSEV